MKQHLRKKEYLGASRVIFVLMLILSNLSVSLWAEEKRISLGSGSYTTQRPEPCQALPEKIYRVPSLQGAMPTNQWWSSVVWEPYSQNLFAHPLSLRCQKGGLAVTDQGARVSGQSGHIMGLGFPESGDFVIEHSTAGIFTEANLAGYSDWFITVEFRKEKAKLQASFGHGSPFVFCRHEGGKPRLRFAKAPKVWAGDKDSAVLGITIDDRHYGLFGATGSTWSGGGSAVFTNETDQTYSSIALLPDNKPETLALFSRYAHNHVVETRFLPEVQKGHVKTRYQYTTESLEGTMTGTIFALYPHQWKYSKTPLTSLSYGSVRGTMKVATGQGFQTSIPIQGLLPMFPKEGIPDRARMRSYLKKELTEKKVEYKDTYWEGKLLGKLTSLSGMAEVIGEAELQQQFVREIKRRLENWFTASPGENAPLFYYNQDWGTLIGSRPSYGSDSALNDHHFHYGYFIRAAAEVARLDPEWAKDWGPMVKLLIRDIASPDRQDPLFPRVRCFDMYAGHSWASGNALFADGNNQESSSESMNAWYALMLWGEVTGDHVIRDAGIALYNTERTAVEEYWFDVSETNFPRDFPHAALGMVWGGKGAFTTWFSEKADHIYGINWLPFTPASIYMGRFPDYVKKSHDQIVGSRETGRDYNTGWGDLIVMFNALNDPAPMVAYLEQHPDCLVEPGNTHAFMYHWLNTLDQLGLNDASVTADHPFFNVYTKDGKKTYSVYHFGETPLEVRFSDGTRIMAQPKGFTMKRE